LPFDAMPGASGIGFFWRCRVRYSFVFHEAPCAYMEAIRFNKNTKCISPEARDVEEAHERLTLESRHAVTLRAPCRFRIFLTRYFFFHG